MIQELIDTFEDLKKKKYFIDMGKGGLILIEFNDENFYHLAGLHKVDLSIYFPKGCISKEKQYKYIKTHVNKFEKVLLNKIKENRLLTQRIKTFKYIPDIFKNVGVNLYNVKENKQAMSLYNGDYALSKTYQEIQKNGKVKSIYCVLGLKNQKSVSKNFLCAPQSWMASDRPNSLIEYKKPLYICAITAIPTEIAQLETLTTSNRI